MTWVWKDTRKKWLLLKNCLKKENIGGRFRCCFNKLKCCIDKKNIICRLDIILKNQEFF